MHLFTTEDAEDTEVNLVHAGTEMNESFFIFHKPEKYKNICHLQHKRLRDFPSERDTK